MHMFVLVPTLALVSTWGFVTPITIVLSAAITLIVCSIIAFLISKLPGGKYIVG